MCVRRVFHAAAAAADRRISSPFFLLTILILILIFDFLCVGCVSVIVRAFAVGFPMFPVIVLAAAATPSHGRAEALNRGEAEPGKGHGK